MSPEKTQEVIDLLDQTRIELNRTLSEGAKHVAKNVLLLLDGDEVRAWDRFMSACASSAPPMPTPEALVDYCEEASRAFVLRRRELFDDGPGIPRTDEGSKLRALIQSAQQLEAKCAVEGWKRPDLAERAQLLRNRIDIACGVTPPEPLPLSESPSAKNAAAERRAAKTATPNAHEATNGATQVFAAHPNGTTHVIDVEVEPGQ